jgi:predicted signal transduction protein with EAL and GGDEF domain/DNA-binding NarL/FixJ family response regulator
MSEQQYLNNRILVIDDQPDIHADFKKVLSPGTSGAPAELNRLRSAIFGRQSAQDAAPAPRFQIDSALQGQEGVAKVRDAAAAANPYALAFVDMRMPPGWDGLQTIQELWLADPELQIVLCTAFSDNPWEQIDRVAGSSDRLLVLKKPFDAVEIKRLAIAGTSRWTLARKAALKRVELEHAVAESTAELMLARQQDQLRLEQLEEMVRLRTAELRRAACHDELTGLPNRALFHDRLSRALVQARQSQGEMVAVLFIDCDRFKVINDSLGHQAGDRLLKTIAERLRSALRASDLIHHNPNDMEESGPIGSTAARLGGDEFCLLLTGLKRRADVESIAQRILTAFETPCNLGREVHISASIGIAISEHGMEAAEDMVRDADIAMYRAKSAGRGCHVIFDVSMHAAVMERLILENELRRAVERQELRTYFQPVVSLLTGEIKGAEALLRWQHPTRGLVQPLDFIGVSEEIGLIDSLGLWILEDACTRLTHWKRQFTSAGALTVSVNVSGYQLNDPKFVHYVHEVLGRTGLDPQSLILEITESVLLNSHGQVPAMLNQLRKTGVRTYLDDFGTGHSSLAVLHQFPLDGLKIDRSFVSGDSAPRRFAAIIHSIMSLVHNLGMEVIAEGVETMEQVALLQTLGCSRGQGYLFAQPTNAQDMLDILRAEPKPWIIKRESAA